MINPVTISRVTLRNYKSIARCSVTESLNTSLDHALRERGGINEVRRRSAGHPTHFGIRLDLILPDDRAARCADSFDKCYREIVQLLGKLRGTEVA